MACLWAAEYAVCALMIYIGLAQRGGPLLQPGPAVQAVMMAGCISAMMVAIGLYAHDLFLGLRRLLTNSTLAALCCFPLIWLAARWIGWGGVLQGDSARVLRAMVVWIVTMAVLRVGLSWAIRRHLFTLRVAVIGDDEQARRLVEAVRAARALVEVAAVIPLEQVDPRAMTAEALGAGRRVDVAIMTDAALAALGPRLHGHRGLPIGLAADFWERRLHRVDIDHCEPRLTAAGAGGSLGAAAHRLFDVALSLVLLLFTFPVMLVTAVVIVCDSPGPMLYRQSRVGRDDVPFTVLKFRSMVTNAEARGPVWASQRDPRVTRVGSFIRLTRIDELPQLWNVLAGEMSFIGPRPERGHFTEQLEQLVPRYRERLLVKPGLTGWAQVNYPYGASVEDARAKLSYDLYYVKHRTLFLDLLILFATVRVVLFQRGAR